MVHNELFPLSLSLLLYIVVVLYVKYPTQRYGISTSSLPDYPSGPCFYRKQIQSKQLLCYYVLGKFYAFVTVIVTQPDVRAFQYKAFQVRNPPNARNYCISTEETRTHIHGDDSSIVSVTFLY